jgi:hypothetical protein
MSLCPPHIAQALANNIPSLGTNQDSFIKLPQSHKWLRYKGKGKGKIHPRTGHEGPDGE